MPARQALRSLLPLALIFAVAALPGLATVGDFGLNWDEPAFYQYADAIGQSYSILMTTRNNADLRVHVGDPILFSIGRLGAPGTGAERG